MTTTIDTPKADTDAHPALVAHRLASRAIRTAVTGDWKRTRSLVEDLASAVLEIEGLNSEDVKHLDHYVEVAHYYADQLVGGNAEPYAATRVQNRLRDLRDAIESNALAMR